MGPYYTIRELRQLYTCSAKYLRELRQLRGAPAGVMVGNKLLFPKKEWDTWAKGFFGLAIDPPKEVEVLAEDEPHWDSLRKTLSEKPKKRAIKRGGRTRGTPSRKPK